MHAGAGEGRVVVLMGVSGCGKTTIGRMLADALGWRFHDSDDDHPPANVAKMSRGEPLTDADRIPWLRILAASIRGWVLDGDRVVLACSALKQRYRDLLADGSPAVRFVYLKGSPDLIRRRMEARSDHFMPPGLLDTQFAALEEPPDALTVTIDRPPAALVADIRRQLDQAAQ